MSPATRNVTPAKKKINPPSGDLSIVIPAAGMGHRMKSYGPKALIKLYQDVTLIERQIELLWSVYPNSEILVVIGFEADKIRKKLSKYPVRFIYNPIHQNTNVLYSIGLAMQAIISEEVLIVYGDLIFNEHALNSISSEGSCVVIDSKNRLSDDEIGVSTSKNRVLNFAYGLDSKWCGIVFLQGEELEMAKKFCVRDKSKMCSFEVLNYIINNGGKIRHIEPQNLDLIKISSVKDFHTLRKNCEHYNSFKVSR